MPQDELSLDSCLKCTICNTACPVMSAHPQYPGPKRLGPELERLRREGLPADSPWVEYCLGCHRCDVACPNQVEVSTMIARAKAAHRKPLVRALRDWWFARPGLLGRLNTLFPALSNWMLALRPARFLMAAFMQIGPQRRFPRYTRPNLRTPAANGNARPRVLFFPGCFIRYNQPELGRTIVELLARNGFAAEIADTECCGVPALANGDLEQARKVARANVERLLAAGPETRIVTACSSCGHTLKTAFGGVLAGDEVLADAAQNVAERTYDLAELLTEQANAGQLNTSFHPVPVRLAYHAPCHLRSQGIGRPWYHLLRQIPGVTIEDLDAGCCGMSGTYGFKREKYEVSMTIGSELFARINAARPQMVATECATCQMQIEHGAHLPAIHPAEILLQAYNGRAQ